MPAFAVAGVIGSVLIAEGFQLGHRPADGPARGLVTLLVTLLSVAFGMFVSSAYSPRRGPRTSWDILDPELAPAPARTPRVLEIAGRAILGGAVAMVVVALMLRLIVWSGGVEYIVGSVAIGTLAWAPILVLLTHLHHRGARSRGGSLVRACDERAVWFALAAVALLGSAGMSFIPENSHLAGRSVARAMGLLALLLMPWFAGRNCVALVRAWRLARAAERLHRTSELSRDLHMLDLGVGEDVFEERAGGSAYRTAPATRVVFGSPEATLRIVRRDAVALGAIASLAIAMVAARGLS